MAKSNQNLSLLSLFEKFISESQRGKRLQKNGTRLKPSTVKNYKSTLASLKRFEIHTQKTWLFNTNYKHSKVNFVKEKSYYKKFYHQFTSFQYSRGLIDNTVALNIKNLRTLFGYLISAKGYVMGEFYKDFYVCREEIPVTVLNQEQLKFLIHDKEFEQSLPLILKQVKDILVVGCTVGLRFSDLITLNHLNLEQINDSIYIVTKSQKTNTETRIKIPEYVINILNLYKGKQKTLLPQIAMNEFNKHFKKIGKLAGWTNETGKIRSRRGVGRQCRNTNGKLKRFYDLLSSHVMRKTAVTTMLMLGMKETLVRIISGHSPRSTEFYKYVKYSDAFMDEETDKVFAKLAA